MAAPETALVSSYLLGLASGVALLPVLAFCQISTGWVRGLLIVGQALAAFSHALTASLGADPAVEAWAARIGWAAAAGTVAVSAFAVDQLLRHPAMTPRRLLLWIAPFLAGPLAAAVLGPGAGWATGAAQATGAVFSLLFAVVTLWLAMRLPVPKIRLMLGFLAAAHLGLLAAGLPVFAMIPTLGVLARLFLYVSFAAAYGTAERLLQGG